MEHAEARTSKTAAALLFVVLALLLTPIGVVVTHVVAQSTGGPGQPGVLIGPDYISDAVAATPAEFRVDESGAATYSVPIYAVPGTAGVAPQLSLNYSSQGGYGPMGRGWSVGGLSAISRCRATREAGDFLGAATPDGNPRPINFSGSDRYCLDGQRLVQSATASCPAASGLTAQELRTELESFQRVCAYHHPTDGPAFFTVERKDGSTSWYGDRDNNGGANRPDGYFETTAPFLTTRAISWAQTRFQDSTGNTIDYHYLENPAGAGAGEHLISEVRYTGKVALSGQTAPASAPFARLVFNYAPRNASYHSKGYLFGGLLTQSRRLESITSCATIECLAWMQARHYVLAYQGSPSGSEQEVLVGLQECRDSRLQGCASPTTFEWSAALHHFATEEAPGSLAVSNSNFRGFKLGDLNGDGRPDLAALYVGSGSCSSGAWVVTALGTQNGMGQPSFSNTTFNCVPTNITARGDGAWHLFDYNGDGLDDLFVSSAANTGWRIHPSVGTHFNMSVNLIAGLSPNVPSVDSQASQVQLADLNGDGLTDILYPRGGELKARLMARQGGAYGWGAERSMVISASGMPPDSLGCDDPYNPDVRYCYRVISGLPTVKTGFMQMADFNGDAASDVLIRISTHAEIYVGGPGCDVIIEPRRQRSSWGDDIRNYLDPSLPKARASANSCWQAITIDELHAFVIDTQDASTVQLASYGMVAGGNPHTITLADFNGDGLTDVAHRPTASSNWIHVLNTGRLMAHQGALPTHSYPDQTRFVDVTGDGRADIVHLVDHGGYKAYAVRRALPDGTFAASTPMPGGNARICNGGGCNEQQRVPVFADFDGDGGVDFLSMDVSSSNIGLYFSRGLQRFIPRDTIVRITNGLGAKTELRYAPLTNTAVYRRATGSRNALTWGRGSPVADFLTPMYVVAIASSSSPQAGAPNAMASVHYRYSNARMQAGGRGFLGFGVIETIDANRPESHVVTSTQYAQNFPFVGMPMQTVKSVVGSSYTIPVCLTGAQTNSCFDVPGSVHPSLGGSLFSNSQQAWEMAPTTLVAQTPIHVRTMGTEEIVRDPFNGVQTSKVSTAFDYGTNGNVTHTVVDTYTGTSLTATVITDNTYSDNVAKWRLGRLTASTVTHRRAGQPDVVRTTGFNYQMSGTTTGLLLEEHLQPGGGAQLASSKSYHLDDYGNRLQTTTCAGAATPCSTSGFQFRPTTTTAVRRYARVEYDAQGRFQVATFEPFGTTTAGEEHRTSAVYERNIFGDPITVFDANNVRTYSYASSLGRDYFKWQQTTVAGSQYNSGVRSITTYRTCSQVDCPSGAAFRQQVEATASPRLWTYLDVLGRPVMKASETFNIGVADEDVSASCTDYDAVGNPWRVSNPFFLAGTAGANGPTGLGSVCATGSRQWTVTSYDALGRPTLVVAPDSSQSSVAYAGLTTTRTDPRGNPTVETRNGLGEVVAVTDAAGLTVDYAFDAAGNITSVSRNAGTGNISSTFVYDVLGRKVQQSDPDTGLTSFEYNALGELTAKIDSLGNRTEHAIDARGRIWQTTVKDFNGLTESESTFTFDLSMMGGSSLGQLTKESITGTYAGWSGQANTALSFEREHYFDQLGRPYGSVTQADANFFSQYITYDALGRPWQASDTSEQAVKTEYGLRGHANALCATQIPADMSPTCQGSDTYQRTLRADAWGNVARERRGDSTSLEVVRGVWPLTGRVASICAGGGSCNLVDEQYGWDAAGNLSSHAKEQRYLEGFTYDNLNRLSTGALLMRDGVTVNQSTVSMGYDALGNICSRNGTGYGYGSAAGCSGTSGMSSWPQASLATARPSAPVRENFASRAGNRNDTARSQVVWHVPAAWRESFAHHAPELGGHRDRASFMGNDRDRSASRVGASGDSFWSRRATTTSAELGAGNSPFAGSLLASAMSSGGGGPHAVSQTTIGASTTAYTYDHRGNQISRDAPGTATDRTIQYSLDDKAHEILMGNGQRVRFWYGPDGQRYKREDAGKTTYYVGGMEVVVQGGTTTLKRHVGGIALQTVVGGVVQSTKYLFHDQLGSLVRIANADGSLAERLDYQAFGGRRDPSDPHAAGVASPNTPRGYTGHEFVDGTGVIHMNGRIYDSELGRFLQADPVIQAPYNTQSWNAYTYVFNNPFAYTDPTGMISFRQILGIAIAVIGTWVTGGMDGGFFAKLGTAMAFGAASGYVMTGTFRGAVTGAFTAGATFGVGWQIQNWGVLDKVIAQAVTGGVMESLQGGKFGSGFLSAGMTAAIMPTLRIRNDVVRTATGALVGGSISKATGGKFANGAIGGAIQAAMMGARVNSTSKGTVGDGSDSPSERDPVAAAKAERLANLATKKAGIYVPYESAQAAADAWWNVIKDLGLEVEVGVMISKVGRNYLLSTTYSDGLQTSVSGLIGHPVAGAHRGAVAVAYAHTHPNNPNLSGGGMAYSLGNYGANGVVVYGGDMHGDMRTGYENRLSAFSYSPTGSDYWSYDLYRAMQVADPFVPVTLCAAATSGCNP